VTKFSKKANRALLDFDFDKGQMLNKRLPYERLDQLTIDIILGNR